MKAAVQQALKEFGKKDGEGVPLGRDGKKGEAAVVAAVKEVYRGSAGQTPSVGRALEFLKALKAGIEAAQGKAPAALQMSTEATSKAMDPGAAGAAPSRRFRGSPPSRRPLPPRGPSCRRGQGERPRRPSFRIP